MDHFAQPVAHVLPYSRLGTIAAQHGTAIEEFADRGWFCSQPVRAPADNRIEFATLPPGFTLEAPLEHLGARLGYSPKFVHRRAEIETYFKTMRVDFQASTSIIR